MRRDSQPYLIDESGKHHALRRIPFGEKRFAEDDLQRMIAAAPDILPINQLDPSFGPLISLGREIVGIDNLLISPLGKITIVEVKLWRNPEATREVIAQLVEYADRLWQLPYEEFESMAKMAMKPAPLRDKSIFDLVRGAGGESTISEPEFHDSVQKCLNDAEFMLLIVGDGIRENVQSMTDLLHQPQMQFKFGLVELQLFDSPAIPHRLVVPQIIAHSTELRRTIVKVEGGGKASVSVQMTEPAETKARRVLTEEEFFSELRDEKAAPLFKDLMAFAEELGATPKWRASSVSMHMPDPKGSGQKITLFLLRLNSEVSDEFYGWTLGQASIDGSIAQRRAHRLGKLFNIPVNHVQLVRDIPWKLVSDNLAAFKDIIRDSVREIMEAVAAKKNTK